MKHKNMGLVDKIIRLTIAGVILALYFTGTIAGTFGAVLLVLAGMLVFTSLIGFCSLYALFGIRTCPIKEEK